MSEQNKSEQSARYIKRRDLLQSMGMGAAGAALITGGLALGSEYFKEQEGVGSNDATIIEQIPNIAALRLYKGKFDGQQVYVISHSSEWIHSPIQGRGPTGGGMFTRISVSNLDHPADNNGTIIIVDHHTAWIRNNTTECRVDDFGAIPDGVTNNDTAIWAAITSIRANPVVILQEIGANSITAYSSGRVVFGRGVYVVSPDVLEITQDMGLQLAGQGYRGTNNSIRAATTLLFSGKSDGFGIRFYGAGSRSALIQDMDICYAHSDFTGDLIDSDSSPGLKLNRVFVGTFGITGATRLRSARCGIRATYDEFNHFQNVSFDGLHDGWWSDELRGPFPFGGSLTSFDNCVFYDITNNMIRLDGIRGRNALSIKNTAFNPIQVSCQRAIHVDNIDGIHIDNCMFAGSTTQKAEIEWVKITNCTGVIHSSSFNDFSKAGTLSGMLEVTGNIIYCTDGFTLIGGTITGRNNEFSKTTAGYRVSPNYPLTMQLGPDLFKDQVDISYHITPNSIDLYGTIYYAPEQDASLKKFINEGAQVRITSASQYVIPVHTTDYPISILLTGRDVAFVKDGPQNFELPVPIAGTEIGVMVVRSGTKTLTTPSGVVILAGSGSSLSRISSSSPGAYVKFRAYGTQTWVVISRTGSWV